MDTPLDLLVIDIDANHAGLSRQTRLTIEEITCKPLRAILIGLASPGTWITEPAEMDFESFMSSAIGSASPASPLANTVELNLAIASQEYLNLSLKLGYHYNVIDCVMSPESNRNYIYFRFTGGMTDISRRSRRTQLIGLILEKYDFVTEINGDLISGRIKNLSEEMLETRLAMIGRLIGFTRQLDIYLKSDDRIDYYLDQFLKECGAWFDQQRTVAGFCSNNLPKENKL